MSRSRTVLITGASSGIGRAMACWWAARGATVLAAARRLDRLEALAAEREGIVPVRLDVAAAQETVTTVRRLDDEHGGIDTVVANAGIGDATPGDLDSWETCARVLQVNVVGAAATIAALMPRMVERGQGRIAGVSSIGGYLGLGAYGAYSGSKAFMSIYLQSLRVDAVKTGVSVTCIEPGFVKSEMSAKIEGHAPMPFIAKTDDAAAVFCRAVERRARRVAYPRIHAWASRLLTLVPGFLYEPLARRASEPQRRLLPRKPEDPRR